VDLDGRAQARTKLGHAIPRLTECRTINRHGSAFLGPGGAGQIHNLIRTQLISLRVQIHA
jgi:hypothetical protein